MNYLKDNDGKQNQLIIDNIAWKKSSLSINKIEINNKLSVKIISILSPLLNQPDNQYHCLANGLKTLKSMQLQRH